MTMAVEFVDGRMADDDFLSLGDSPDRLELFDGSLVITPSPNGHHQGIAVALASNLLPSADAAGLHLTPSVDVRLRPGRLVVPDLIITGEIEDLRMIPVEVESVLLVCEITAPPNADTDKVLKRHYYAAAGIPWYLLVESDTGVFRLYREQDGQYVEHATAEGDKGLELTEPVAVTLVPDEIMPSE